MRIDVRSCVDWCDRLSREFKEPVWTGVVRLCRECIEILESLVTMSKLV